MRRILSRRDRRLIRYRLLFQQYMSYLACNVMSNSLIMDLLELHTWNYWSIVSDGSNTINLIMELSWFTNLNQGRHILPICKHRSHSKELLRLNSMHLQLTFSTQNGRYYQCSLFHIYWCLRNRDKPFLYNHLEGMQVVTNQSLYYLVKDRKSYFWHCKLNFDY